VADPLIEAKDHMKVLLREWGHQQLRHFFGVDFSTGQISNSF